MNKIYLIILLSLQLQITVAQVSPDATVISLFNELDEPLSENSVYISSSNQPFRLYITDFAGKIRLAASLPITIKIERFGYESFTGTYNDHQISIKLIPRKAELSNMVVTGQTETKKAENAPQKITVIDAKKIQQLGAVSLKDVLINELNFRQNNDPFLGATSSIRGIGGQNIKILIDGVPVVGRENGNIDLSQLVLSNIERIEIIEGPMAVNFGSDALAGVINLITKKNVSKKLNGVVSTLCESVGRYNADARLGVAYKKISYSVFGGRYFFSGWDTLPESRQKLWKPKTQYFLENQLHIKIAKTSFIKLQLNYYDELLSAKGPLYISPYEAYSIDQYFKTSRINSIISFEKKLNNHHQLSIVASAQKYLRIKNTLYKDHVNLKEILTPTDDEQDTNTFITFMSRGTYNATYMNRKIQWQAGYEITHNIASGDKLIDETQKITDAALFGNLEYKPNARWLYRIGSRATWNSKFGAPMVPAFNIKFNPNQKTNIRFSYARGFRAPSLKEMYLYFVDQNHRILGNASLKQESSDNFNLDFDRKFHSRKLQYSINSTAYFNSLYQMITLVATNLQINEYTYQNIDSYKNLGITLSGSLQAGSLYIKSGAGIMAVQSKFDNNNFSNITQEINGQLNYKLKKIKTDFSLFYKYNGKQANYMLSEDGKSASVYTISGYHWLDFSAIRTFYNNHLNITIGLKNLLNVKNINTSGSNGIAHSGGNNMAPLGYGRTVFVNFKYYL